jgi:hypothetical protein
MMLEKIYIPTLGRLHNQVTYNNLPQRWKDITYFVVQPHEYELACSLYPNVLCLPETVKGIAKTRKWIVETAGDSYYAMMDDDIDFLKRNINRETKKKIDGLPSKEKLTEEDFEDLLDKTVNRWFNEGVTVGGLTFHAMYPKDFDEKDFGIIIQCFFVNGSNIPREKLDWSIEFGEDHHFILQLLKMKLKTRVSDKYLISSKEWAPGGCQEQGRTPDSDRKEHLKLIEAHPGIVEWSGKTRKHSKGHDHAVIRINWKKCYNSGTATLENFL